jgi:carboxymethylenebutenolidase
MGFCWGGGMVNQLAVHSPDLVAGVAFYGRVPAAEDVAKIKARMMLHYAGLDDRINEGIAGYKAALESAGINHVIHMYEAVNHAFHNDTSAARYDKAAAELAWSRTIAFLKEATA